MKFCDKLPKVRKNNNLSQEQLADKLGVSRQAISKWESGSSYPSMDTMIHLCDILNCTLEELLDDGLIKESEKSKKTNYNNYWKDLLQFITKTYNMFYAMSGKEKIKSLFELGIIALILFILGHIVLAILSFIVKELHGLLPFNLGVTLSDIFTTIFTIAILIVSIIIFIHLFKIRYLDYYITIEDNSANKKTIEKAIEQVPEKKEKIVIRDPQHSRLSFINMLGSVTLWCIKLLSIFILFPIILSFIFFVILLTISLYHLPYGTIFIYLSISCLGIIMLSYIFIELIYKFIFNLQQKYLKIFIIFISSIIITAIGTGLSIVTFINYDQIEGLNKIKTIEKEEYLEISNNKISINNDIDNNIEYIIDNNQKQIKLDITCAKGFDYKIEKYTNEDTNHYYIGLKNNTKKYYQLFLNDIKHKQIRSYENSDLIYIKAYISQENYNKLINKQ